MGLTVITKEADTSIGQMDIDFCGKGQSYFTIADISTSGKIGIDMVEFKNNETPKDFEYQKTSTFHFCVQDTDVAGLVEEVIAHGGKQTMPIRQYYPGEKLYPMFDVEDPFGLIFKIIHTVMN